MKVEPVIAVVRQATLQEIAEMVNNIRCNKQNVTAIERKLDKNVESGAT